jgi:hypothetical protein
MGERARGKLRSRGIDEWEPFEVFFNRWVLLKNKRHRAASHRLVGKTDSGRLLTLLVKESRDTGIWEVVNGWDSSKGERTLFERRAR